jgi:biopolymer transport protein ExbD/TM2 domain-containing membrane protein YozV
MDWIQAQRSLSDKDLVIFNAELQRRSKSTVLAYVLWFLLGSAGVHNFYMGKVHWGLLYLVLGVFGWFFFLAALVAGASPYGATDRTAGTATLGILALGLLGLFLLWDLFTIPRQIALREEGIKQDLLARLGATGQEMTHLEVTKDPRRTARTVWISALLLALISASTLFFLLHGRHPRYTTEEEKQPLDILPGRKNAEMEKKDAVQAPSVVLGTTVTLTPKREIYVNQKKVTEESLESALKEAVTASPDKTVILRGDRDVLLQEAVKVMSIAKRAGASEVAIAAEPERTKK